jgi:hypothetical protein
MSWWASELAGGNEPPVAVLHDWYQRFGAELVAHWGTMLQIVVSRRPGDPEAAWHLALEHELIAPPRCSNFRSENMPGRFSKRIVVCYTNVPDSIHVMR